MSDADENADRPNPEREADATRSALDDDELIRKDVSESPGSERETAAKQDAPMPETVADDVDPARVRAVPGTGGPDDSGDVDVDPGELHVPRSTGAQP